MNRTFFIAGVQFRGREAMEAIKKLKEGDLLMLEPEPANKFDPNAVKICSPERNEFGEPIHLGYVSKVFSPEVAGLLEAEFDLECVVTDLNPSAKPWEMCKVTIKDATVEEEEEEEE